MTSRPIPSVSLSVYFSEAINLLIAVLRSNQFIVQKSANASFIYIDRTGNYSGISPNIDLLEVIRECGGEGLFIILSKIGVVNNSELQELYL